MAKITVSKSLHLSGAMSFEEAFRALAQSVVKLNVTGPMNGVTNNSAGVVGPTLAFVAPLKDAAASGSDRAGKASTETSLGTVKDALATLFTVVNGLSDACGLPLVTYNGGGTVGDPTANSGAGDNGVVKAVGKTSTGAATGATAAGSKATVDAVNAAIYTLAVAANGVAHASGEKALHLGNSGALGLKPLTTVPAISTDTGSAAATSVSAADFAAALTTWANDIASVADLVNRITSTGKPAVLAVA